MQDLLLKLEKWLQKNWGSTVQPDVGISDTTPLTQIELDEKILKDKRELLQSLSSDIARLDIKIQLAKSTAELAKTGFDLQELERIQKSIENSINKNVFSAYYNRHNILDSVDDKYRAILDSHYIRDGNTSDPIDTHNVGQILRQSEQAQDNIWNYYHDINSYTQSPYKDMPGQDMFIMIRLQEAKKQMLVKQHQEAQQGENEYADLTLMELKAKLDARDAMNNRVQQQFINKMRSDNHPFAEDSVLGQPNNEPMKFFGYDENGDVADANPLFSE